MRSRPKGVDASTGDLFDDWEWQQALDTGEISRRRAAAAIAAYRATKDGGAEEAVRRILAYCDEIDRDKFLPGLADTDAIRSRAALAPQDSR
jgi:hypothetical protein